MRVDGHSTPDGEPEPEGGHIAGHDDHEVREALDEQLDPVRVCRGKSHGCWILVVDVVDLVVRPPPVQKPMQPVAELVLHEHVHQ